MDSARSLVSICFGALSLVCMVGSLCTDCWQVNSKGSVVLSMRCRGLWGECVWDKFVKIRTCDVFSSYLNPHPAAIVLTRAFVITSAVAGIGAFLCLLLGCRHFRCCQEPTARHRCLCFSVGFYLFSGFTSSVGVIRYGVYVFSQHQYEVSLRIPGFPSFEYGYSLWMAVAGNLAALLAAFTTYWDARLLKTPSTSPAKEHAGNSTGAEPSRQAGRQTAGGGAGAALRDGAKSPAAVGSYLGRGPRELGGAVERSRAAGLDGASPSPVLCAAEADRAPRGALAAHGRATHPMAVGGW
ncbi:claudin-16-like [Paroedura picta]|uniref:claudin-16-like n=1 Tax=Paroedura picta TaxID=143630 RepID=UPI00405657D8